MLIYIDESGDTGNKFGKGSSAYFLLAMTFYENEVEEENANEQIQKLKKAMGYSEDFEFHFSSNSKEQRFAFLEKIKKIKFNFNAIILNKRSRHYKNKKDLYCKALCDLLRYSETPEPVSKIIFDEFFRKGEIPAIEKAILMESGKEGKKVKIQQKNSQKSNHIQIADYVVGILNRWASHKPDCEKYYDYIHKKQKIVVFK